MEEVHLPVMPYAYVTGQDGPSQFDDQFKGLLGTWATCNVNL